MEINKKTYRTRRVEDLVKLWKTALVLSLLLSVRSSLIHAQYYTIIPDSAFEQALIDLGIDSQDTLDGWVLRSDLAHLIELDIRGRGIKNLKGLEACKDLRRLYAQDNELNYADLYHNMLLQEVDLSNNVLRELKCDRLYELKSIKCRNNLLRSVDLINHNREEEIDFRDNPELKCIQVEDSEYASNNYTLVDESVTFNTHCEACEWTYFPDELTELLLVRHFEIDTTGIVDGWIPNTNLADVTRMAIFVYPPSRSNWQNFYGLRSMSNLEFLWVTDFRCDLTYLDLSGLQKLNLFAYENRVLQELIVDGLNDSLSIVRLENTELRNLDLSELRKIRGIGCRNNNLSYVNLKNNHNDNITSLVFRGNPDLGCIQVDSAIDNGQSFWKSDPNATKEIEIDASVYFSSDCGYQDEDTVFVTSAGTSLRTPRYIQAFPNPAFSEIYLQLAKDVTVSSYDIYDMAGRRTKSGSIQNIDLTAQISIDELPHGIYLLYVQGPEVRERTKFIKLDY